jgi:nucleotide-binding universal stress UspA family protein
MHYPRPMIGKILCPVDYSAPSQAALRVAARIAAAHGSELVVAHAFHFAAVAAVNETPLPATSIQLVQDDERRGLEAAVHEARQLGATKVTSEFLEGSPWHELVELGIAQQVDLIVIGTHGRTGLKRLVVGSVAEKVVRHAASSVLVVRANPDGPTFDHVLCPVDLSEDTSQIVERAEQLAQPNGIGIDLLHALQLPLAASGDPLLADHITAMDARATAQLERYADEVRNRKRVGVRSEVLTGNPSELILAKAEEDRTIDLIAVGSHGRTGLKRLVMGSVAENLVRHAPCSVLVVRGR